MPRLKTLMDSYDVWSSFYDEFENPLIPIEEMSVRSLLQTIAFENVLDAGTGTGRHAIYLAQQGKRVSAIDLNEKMLSKAKEKAGNEGLTIDFRLEDLSGLSFSDNTFDLVICALALAHMEILAIPLKEFMRVLRPGGNLIITDLHPLVQNKLGPEHRWELIEGQEPVPFPNYHSSVDEYLTALNLVGYKTLAALDIPMKLKDELFPGALLLWAMKPSEYH
jgi:ubiquinone/menaquinone biosynthesis C-methylase UbiE